MSVFQTLKGHLAFASLLGVIAAALCSNFSSNKMKQDPPSWIKDKKGQFDNTKYAAGVIAIAFGCGIGVFLIASGVMIYLDPQSKW